jgi:nucleotide-binding universal stress UspA family protein
VTIRRVLLCVDASPAAMAAARLTVSLAAGWAAEVRAVYVAQDSERAAAIEAAVIGEQLPAERRLGATANAVLSYVEQLCHAAGVAVTLVLLQGLPFEEILTEARRWRPDLIAIGKAGTRGPAATLPGTVAEQLLEFTEWPVMVVPPRQVAARGGTL